MWFLGLVLTFLMSSFMLCTPVHTRLRLENSYIYTTLLVITTIVYIISSCLLCSMRHLHSQCCKVFGPSLDVRIEEVEVAKGQSAKVCAQNHNARDTFFLLTFYITCVQFQKVLPATYLIKVLFKINSKSTLTSPLSMNVLNFGVAKLSENSIKYVKVSYYKFVQGYTVIILK